MSWLVSLFLPNTSQSEKLATKFHPEQPGENGASSFGDIPLTPELVRGIHAYGLERLSILQQRIVTAISTGQDVVFQASGAENVTGLSISVLRQLDISIKDTQVLVIAPTRELALGIQNAITTIGEPMGIECHACVGGTNARQEKAMLQDRKVQIIVGTPGRLLDMMNRKAIRTDLIRMFCLAGSDDLSSPRFKDKIHDIFCYMPKEKQILFSSPTISHGVSELAEKLMHDPIKILDEENSLFNGIKQFYLQQETWKSEIKLGMLVDLHKRLSSIKESQVVIFCNSKQNVKLVAEGLRSHDISISTMHSKMDQQQRDDVMEAFRSGSCRMLVTTDLLAGDPDMQKASVIINYDFPRGREGYVNRIGRSDHKGIAISFITNDSTNLLKDIENFYHTEISVLPESLDLHDFSNC